MKKYPHCVWYYVRRTTFDSCCLTYAFVLGSVALTILIIFYGCPTFRIPVSWDESKIDSVNNLIVSLCSGYLISYLFYYLSVAFPTAIKTQHKRVFLTEEARLLKDETYSFLNELCEFCESQNSIEHDDWERFQERHCYKEARNQLKGNAKKLLEQSRKVIQQHQNSLEKELEYLYKNERLFLISMENAKMWKQIEQLLDGCIFTTDDYDFLKQVLIYRKLSICLYEEMRCKKKSFSDDELEMTLDKHEKKICSFISIVNINNNK